MKRYFLIGVVTLLPLAVTIWVIALFVHILTNPFLGLVNSLFNYIPIPQQFIRTISQITILISLFLFTLFLGFVARRFFFNTLIRLSDQLLHRIPLVNKVYKTSKEIVISLFGKDKNSFKQSVLLPFPYKGAYCIGLIAREAPKAASETRGEELLSVFIPTAPNPTTGFLIMCKKSELVHLDMASEQAVKYIVSCGMIVPKGKL